MTGAWKRFADAKAEMPNPRKDTSAFSYQYATLDQVRAIVAPALHKHGLMDVQRMLSGELHTTIVDLESGETLVSDVRPTLQKGTDQQRGSSETYQRRYALLTVCGLAPVDDDGAAASNRQPVEVQR